MSSVDSSKVRKLHLNDSKYHSRFKTRTISLPRYELRSHILLSRPFLCSKTWLNVFIHIQIEPLLIYSLMCRKKVSSFVVPLDFTPLCADSVMKRFLNNVHKNKVNCLI